MSPSLAVIIPTLDEEQLLPRLLERLLGERSGRRVESSGRAPLVGDRDPEDPPVDSEGLAEPGALPGGRARDAVSSTAPGGSCHEAAVASVSSRPDRADRVIVTDGGSRDATCSIARAAGCEVVVGGSGRGAQLARGAVRANEEVLLFLHADSLPEPGALAALRQSYERAATRATAMSQRIEAPGGFYRAVERFADFRSRRLGLVYGDSGLAVRRSLYEESGGFREMSLFEDVEFSRRLKSLTRIELVQGARLAISARRWRQEGALSCTLRNWMLLGAYFLGRDPERLARHYQPHSSSEDSR